MNTIAVYQRIKLLKKLPKLIALVALFSIASIVFGVGKVHAAPSEDFVTTWKTDNPGISNSSSIVLPVGYATYNYNVDWNNDGTFDQFGITGGVTHDFGVPGTYTIRISGEFPISYFEDCQDDSKKLVDINQWGTNIWSNMNNAFCGASNLHVTASDSPNLSQVTNMSNMFNRGARFPGR